MHHTMHVLDASDPIDSEHPNQVSAEVRWLVPRVCVGPPLAALSAHCA